MPCYGYFLRGRIKAFRKWGARLTLFDEHLWEHSSTNLFGAVAVHRLIRTQHIPASAEAIWGFFSDARNLQAITPAHLRFRVLNPEDAAREIYPGQIISYRVSPLLGIPLFWMTEITAVKRYRLFVDEQRRGPYRLWHHQHLFEEGPDGVTMTDLVHYELPLGPFGNAAHALFVRRQVAGIFDFRTAAIAQHFHPAGA